MSELGIPDRMIVMGVAGSGKSSVGEALAAHVGAVYLDGDALHPKANIDNMSAGIPLTDEDRLPWLREVGSRLKMCDGKMIIGCSALKRTYREIISAEAASAVTFVYLSGSKDVIAKRMRQRAGHFMPTSLLDSQFAVLEEPGPDENAIHVNIDQPFEALVRDAATRLERVR